MHIIIEIVNNDLLCRCLMHKAQPTVQQTKPWHGPVNMKGIWRMSQLKNVCLKLLNFVEQKKIAKLVLRQIQLRLSGLHTTAASVNWESFKDLCQFKNQFILGIFGETHIFSLLTRSCQRGRRLFKSLKEIFQFHKFSHFPCSCGGFFVKRTYGNWDMNKIYNPCISYKTYRYQKKTRIKPATLQVQAE